jgi:hypothetical protein
VVQQKVRFRNLRMTSAGAGLDRLPNAGAGLDRLPNVDHTNNNNVGVGSSVDSRNIGFLEAQKVYQRKEQDQKQQHLRGGFNTVMKIPPPPPSTTAAFTSSRPLVGKIRIKPASHSTQTRGYEKVVFKQNVRLQYTMGLIIWTLLSRQLVVATTTKPNLGPLAPASEVAETF